MIVETADPFLGSFGLATDRPFRRVSVPWQQRLEGAWRILVRQDRLAAAGLASVLTTLVPLNQPETGDLVSATSGWAWGAVATSLPADVSLLAETIYHEFHHLILAAVEDITPLVRADNGALYYAPWRDDPRPASALIQGIYAHLGVATFWRRQRRTGPPCEQLPCEVNFVRAYRAALGAARTLAGVDSLTGTGRILITGVLRQLESWEREPVSYAAESIATGIGLEHQLRWRLAHRHPNSQTTEVLAHAWISGHSEKLAGRLLPSDVSPYKYRLGDSLSEFLKLRYRDPVRFREAMSGNDPNGQGDIALLNGDYLKAERSYAHQITVHGERGAWVGLLLSQYYLARTSEPSREHPEIIAGVYERVRSLTGISPSPEGLITWLNGILLLG
jgi:hypothetical protein